MRTISWMVAVTVTLVASSGGSATPVKPPAFALELTIEVDGREDPIKSTLSLPTAATPVILPPSLWSCFVRATNVTNGFYGKELVCVINKEDGKEPITQVGTVGMAAPSVGINRPGYVYLREGVRVFRFLLEAR
jgi:hypothetical protein